MKKFIYLILAATLLLTACGKEEEYISEEVIEKTNETTEGVWINDEGEEYNLNIGYKFQGKVFIDGAITEVEGNYSLVTDEVSKEVTLTIDCDNFSKSYIMEVSDDGKTMSLLDINSGEIIKGFVKN